MDRTKLIEMYAKFADDYSGADCKGMHPDLPDVISYYLETSRIEGCGAGIVVRCHYNFYRTVLLEAEMLYRLLEVGLQNMSINPAQVGTNDREVEFIFKPVKVKWLAGGWRRV